uniref:Protein kinase domain-containing protein n=1 Tax=Haptolina brevifila TaxID=156173 RepID=A0A7S2BIC0_9EUKA|mmetsp:Transcript_13249/g.26629  ORF Transcript_13249/g.26629 Transcript_13249/m.26629 type:complete len:518 (+) Transcript_13249:7-1560(+)
MAHLAREMAHLEVLGLVNQCHDSVLLHGVFRDHPVHTHCAIKAVSKEAARHASVRRRLAQEQQMLLRMAEAPSPFVVSFVCSAADESFFYLGMTYVGGGDFFSRQMRECPQHDNLINTLHEEHVTLIAAMVVLGLEHLHSHGAIHRNLKLESLLIGLDGYIVLGDLSFAKLMDPGQTQRGTLCGTPEYIAPEVLLGMPYGHAIDYWSLGVLIYELLVGRTPYAAHGDVPTIVCNVLMNQVSYPESLSGVMRRCIKSLLTSSSVRLGGLALTAENMAIQHHACFDQIDWAALAAKQIRPSWVPASLPCVHADDRGVKDNDFSSDSMGHDPSLADMFDLFPEQSSALPWAKAVPSPASTMDFDARQCITTPVGVQGPSGRIGGFASDLSMLNLHHNHPPLWATLPSVPLAPTGASLPPPPSSAALSAASTARCAADTQVAKGVPMSDAELSCACSSRRQTSASVGGSVLSGAISTMPQQVIAHAQTEALSTEAPMTMVNDQDNRVDTLQTPRVLRRTLQ